MKVLFVIGTLVVLLALGFLAPTPVALAASPTDAFDPGANNQVYALALQPDGKILVGGSFTTLGGGGPGTTTRNHIGRVNADGSLDTAFDPGAGGGVIALALQPDGKILVGGSFTTLGGATRNRIGRLNADGSLDTSFDPGADASVFTLAVQPNGQILVGGAFNKLGGGGTGTTNRGNIGRLNADGSLDTAFDPGANNSVHALAVQPNGQILVGGTFITLGKDAAGSLVPRNRIGRLNADGSLDTAFDPGANDTVATLALQANGQILVGGAFTTLGGGGTGTTARNKIGRLNTNGGLDAVFDPGANDHVYALALQPNGKILAGGQFATLGGMTRYRIGRLSADTAAVQTLSADSGGTTITWARSGSGPEVWHVTFEQSTDGTNYTSLGGGTRVAGGWQLSGLTLPRAQNLYLRARGYYATGYLNGSGSIVESVQQVYLPESPCYTLTLDGQPGDTGEVKADPEPNCNYGSQYTAGTNVTLTARAARRFTFTNWSGDASGTTNPTSITMNSDKSVTAHFKFLCYTLVTNVNPGEAGSVTADPPPDCNNDTQYIPGTTVNLTAQASGGYTFSNWSGDASGTTNPISITIDGDKSVTANLTSPCYTLATNVNPGGAGTVTAEPVPNCNNSTQYTAGTNVKLTARASGGYTFSNWSGDANDSVNPIAVTMDRDKNIVANLTALSLVIEDTSGSTQISGWRAVGDTNANGGGYRVSNVKNGQASFTFTGTAVTWVTLKGPGQGKATVTIDNKNKGTFDLYSPTPQYQVAQTFSGLANKSHTLVVKILGKKNVRASGTNVAVDALLVGGATTQEAAPAIQYSSWVGSSDANASGGSYRASANKNANVSLRFSGTSIDWITARGPTYGKAEVWIDGVRKSTEDLFAPTQEWQVKRSYSGLSAGPHTIQIKVLGTKNAKSKGKLVVVDAFSGPITTAGLSVQVEAQEADDNSVE